MKIYAVILNRSNYIFIRTDIYHIVLVVEVAKRIQLQKLLRKTPRIAAAVNIRSFTLYQSKEVNELLNSSGVA